jgi:hypothetical protein
MKPYRPVTLSMIGVCIANVGVATVEAAFGKAKDPLAGLPPAATLGQLLSSASSTTISTVITNNMVTGARYELPQFPPAPINKNPPE